MAESQQNLASQRASSILQDGPCSESGHPSFVRRWALPQEGHPLGHLVDLSWHVKGRKALLTAQQKGARHGGWHTCSVPLQIDRYLSHKLCAHRSAKGVWRGMTALFSLYDVAGFSMPDTRGVLPWPWLLSLKLKGPGVTASDSPSCACTPWYQRTRHSCRF